MNQRKTYLKWNVLPLFVCLWPTAIFAKTIVYNKADIRAGYIPASESKTRNSLYLSHNLNVFKPTDSINQFTLNMELYKDAILNEDQDDQQAFNLSDFFLETEKLLDHTLTLKVGRQSLTEGFTLMLFDGLKADYTINPNWSILAYSGVGRYDKTATKLKQDYLPVHGSQVMYRDVKSELTSNIGIQSRVYNTGIDKNDDGKVDKESALLVSHASQLGRFDQRQIYYQLEGESTRKEFTYGAIGASQFFSKTFAVDLTMSKQKNSYNFADQSQSVYKNFYTEPTTGAQLGGLLILDQDYLRSKVAVYNAGVLGQYNQGEVSYQINRPSLIISKTDLSVGMIKAEREWVRSASGRLEHQNGDLNLFSQLSYEAYKKLNKIEGQYLGWENGIGYLWQNKVTSKAILLFEKLDPKGDVKASFLCFFSYWGTAK